MRASRYQVPFFEDRKVHTQSDVLTVNEVTVTEGSSFVCVQVLTVGAKLFGRRTDGPLEKFSKQRQSEASGEILNICSHFRASYSNQCY